MIFLFQFDFNGTYKIYTLNNEHSYIIFNFSRKKMETLYALFISFIALAAVCSVRIRKNSFIRRLVPFECFHFVLGGNDGRRIIYDDRE